MERHALNGLTSLNGWSNVHNEPIVCSSIVAPKGDSMLVETFDTSGHSHTAKYLTELSIASIKTCESKFDVKVRSFVTDNASNVKKKRDNLKNADIDLIHYGCVFHILNLTAQDVEVPGVQENIIKIIKHFRNKHLPAAWYKFGKGTNSKMVLPIEVRWNTMKD